MEDESKIERRPDGRFRLVAEAQEVLEAFHARGLLDGLREIEVFGSFVADVDDPADVDLMLHFDEPRDDQYCLSGVYGRVHLIVVGGDPADLPMVRWCRGAR